MGEGLRDYLDPDVSRRRPSSPQRLQRFEGQLIAALNAGSPLVSINPAVLVQVHGKNEVSYTTLFSEVPLPDKLARHGHVPDASSRRAASGPRTWRSRSATATARFIDIFTVNSPSRTSRSCSTA